MAISRKLIEADLDIPVLYILNTKGSMKTAKLKEAILLLLDPVGVNQIPLVNRNDSVIHQIVRNIVPHRLSKTNIIYRGLVDYDTNGILSITASGIKYLDNYIINTIIEHLI